MVQMATLFLLALCTASFLLCPTSSLAIWMTKEECKKPLRTGELIMGSEAVFSAQREIRVYRNGLTVKNGGTYVPGEELLVVLHGADDAGLQFVYEVSNAVFIGGGCDGRRLANSKAAKLLLPSDSSSEALDVQIIAGWAAGYETVKITAAFALSAPTVPSAPVLLQDTKANEPPPFNNEEVPIKTNLRKQPMEARTAPKEPASPVDLDAKLPQTLAADHKVKLKPSSPSAYARTHPKKATTLNSKIQVEPVEVAPAPGVAPGVASGVSDGVRAEDPPPVVASPPVLAEPKHVAPPASPPASVPASVPAIATSASAEKEDTPKLKDVLESMKEVSDKVHDRAAHTLRVPAKSPSKRARFADSLHATRPRHAERRPVKLAVGEVQPPPPQEVKAGADAREKKEEMNDDQTKKQDGAEDLPGAHLSATEKRLRRSQEAASLLGGMKFRHQNVMRAEETPEAEAGDGLSAFARAPMKTLLVLIFTGVLVFCGALVFIAMVMFCAGYKAELKSMFARLTRRKQGQDKE